MTCERNTKSLPPLQPQIPFLSSPKVFYVSLLPSLGIYYLPEHLFLLLFCSSCLFGSFESGIRRNPCLFIIVPPGGDAFPIHFKVQLGVLIHNNYPTHGSICKHLTGAAVQVNRWWTSRKFLFIFNASFHLNIEAPEIRYRHKKFYSEIENKGN